MTRMMSHLEVLMYIWILASSCIEYTDVRVVICASCWFNSQLQWLATPGLAPVRSRSWLSYDWVCIMTLSCSWFMTTCPQWPHVVCLSKRVSFASHLLIKVPNFSVHGWNVRDVFNSSCNCSNQPLVRIRIKTFTGFSAQAGVSYRATYSLCTSHWLWCTVGLHSRALAIVCGRHMHYNCLMLSVKDHSYCIIQVSLI